MKIFLILKMKKIKKKFKNNNRINKMMILQKKKNHNNNLENKLNVISFINSLKNKYFYSEIKK